jgi:predicted metal-binding membrane protein
MGWSLERTRKADAARARIALVLLLVTASVGAWWWTADRMRGMDAGPGTALGTLGWFAGAWTVMMAAMMLPSAVPAVARYAHAARARTPAPPLAFAAGYLLTWAAAGVAAYAVFEAGRALLGGQLAWNAGGRPLAGALLVAAAAYELTPLKDACLRRCRGRVVLLAGARGHRLRGAVSAGARHGAWCVGCCAGLMASLFALGVMSLLWMGVIAALIGVEKTLPRGRAATYATAALLALLGALLISAPSVIPGLTIPGGMGGMG